MVDGAFPLLITQKFVQAFDHHSVVLGPQSLGWLESQKENPDYGLGTFLRHTPKGINYWHDGSVATQIGGGAYFVKAYNGWTVVVLFVSRVSRVPIVTSVSGSYVPCCLRTVRDFDCCAETTRQPAFVRPLRLRSLPIGAPPITTTRADPNARRPETLKLKNSVHPLLGGHDRNDCAGS